MTKQEKIKEGMKEILELQGVPYPMSESTVDLILSRQSSQGVVIKMDRKLPENPIKVTNAFGLSEAEVNARQLEGDCFAKVIQDGMLLAGYVATEPLIKEE